MEIERVKLVNTINSIISDLNGLPIKEEDTINKARLQIYAIIVLFYKLNKTWGCFTINYAYSAVYSSYTFKNIIDKAITYESSKEIQR